MMGQLKCVAIALEEFASSTDDNGYETKEVSELSILVNDMERELVDHMVKRGITVSVPVIASNVSESSSFKVEPVPISISNSMHLFYESVVQANTTTTTTTSTTSDNVNKIKMRIEATKLPEFSGLVYRWPTFISTWKKVGEPNIPGNTRAHVSLCFQYG